MLESRAAEPAPQLSDRPQGRAWRESSSQGTSCYLCSREPPHITLIPPTTGKRACLGLASASGAGQCRYPVTDFCLQALRSKQAQSRHLHFTSPRVVDDSRCLHTSRQTEHMTASQWSTGSGHSGPALSNRSVTSANLVQATGPARSGSISSDHTSTRQKEPGTGCDTVEARVVPRAVMNSAAHILLRPCWASPHYLLQAAQALHCSQGAQQQPHKQLECVRTQPY